MKLKRAPTPISWIGLGLSILAVALLFLTGSLLNDTLAAAAGTGKFPVIPWPISLIATAAAFVAAVILDIIAGKRGSGSRLVASLGAVVMLLPVVGVLISLLLSALGIIWP